MTASCEVLVVGAGLSGLRTATRLAEAGTDVVVLEARDRVGGRTLTEVVDGVAYDRGAQWVGPTQHRMHALIDQLGLTTFPTWGEGEAILDVRGERKRYSGTIPPFPILDLLRVHRALGRIDRMTGAVPGHDPTAAPDARRLDSQTLHGFMDRHLPPRAQGALTPAIRVIFGAEPSELSMLWFLTYCAQSGGFTHRIESDGGHQQDRLVEGMGAIAGRLAAPLGDRVVLEAPARRIDHGPDGVTVHTERGAFSADHAIVAVPPHLCSGIDWHPLLPASREQVHQKLSMGSTTKVIATCSRPFWRDAGLSGEVVCDRGPFSILYDNSPQDGRCGALVGFVVGTHARALQGGPEAEQRSTLTTALADFYGAEASAPRQLLIQDWGAERFTRGCPVGNAPPGLLTEAAAALRAPVGRLHWAGTETAAEQVGFMEGALEAGDRAADAVLAARP